LSEFYEASHAALLYRSPETIIWQALTGIYPLDAVGLDDISVDYRRDTYAMYEVVLDALRSYDSSALSPADKLTYNYSEWHLQDAVSAQDFLFYPFAAAYNFMGEHTGTETFFTEIHPLRSEEDANDYITRLEDVPRKFDNLIEFLDLQSGAGVVEPQLTIGFSLYGINRIADAAAANLSYYTAFRDKLDDIAGLSDADRQALLDRALVAIRDHVVPAYRSLRAKLQQLQAVAPDAIGVGQYPMGREYYDFILRHRTTTDLSAAEIHQLGLTHLERIHAKMREVFDQLGYPQNESLAQLFQRVQQDGGIIPAAEVRST